MRLAQVTNRLQQMADDCEVTERLTDASTKLGQVSENVYDRVSVAGEAARQRALVAAEAARRGAVTAYRTALEYPKTSIGGVILAAALVGGALWFVFGNWRKTPVQRRKRATRVRAGTERRAKARAARPAAS